MLVLFINNYIETNNRRQICDWTYALSMAEMHATSSHAATTLVIENQRPRKQWHSPKVWEDSHCTLQLLDD